MKITKTVGQCICCKIDTDVSNWGFGTLKNGENPVVDICRKTVNDHGSVEKLHDFKIFSNGVIKVGPESLLDYNEIVNGSNKSYLQYIMSWLMRAAIDIVYMNGITPDSLKESPDFYEKIVAELKAFPSYV